MPCIYAVIDTKTPSAKPCVVYAASAAQALRHIARQHYAVRTLRATEVALLMRDGGTLENATEAPASVQHGD